MLLNYLLILCISLASGDPLAGNAEENSVNPNTDEKQVYRLPGDVTPTEYTLRLRPDLTASSFTGIVDIEILVIRATREVRLFGKNLIVTKCTITRQEATTECAYTSDRDNHLVIITPTAQLDANAEYTIVLTYSGRLNNDLKGFYRSSYDEDGIKKWLAHTHFEPTYAREAFPCFDEPQYKTPFIIHIARKTNQQAISNMPLQETRDDTSADTKWDIFERSQPMPTYLVVFMISELSKREGTETIKVNALARRNVLPHTTYAIQQVSKIFTSMNEFTNVVSRLTKLDIVAVPESKVAAMEYWGMTSIKERHVILDEASSSTSHKMEVTGLISREISRHWFGNILSPSKWDFLWLSDGFATYFQYYGAALVEPNWNLDDLFVLQVLQPALMMEYTNERALTTSITLPSQFESINDRITNNKAASILRMLKYILSPNSFKAAIQTYLADGQSKDRGSVNPDHLFEALETQVKTDSIALPSQTTITKIMKSWTENAGYPVVHVRRNIVTKKFSFFQRVFTLRPFDTYSPYGAQWQIPVTCATKSSPKFDTTKPTFWLLDKSTVETSLSADLNEWIICNLQHAGYYRIDYDGFIWSGLTLQISKHPESFPAVSKAQLIDDAFTFASSKDLSYTTPLKLVHALEQDTDVIPWIAAINHLRKLWSKSVNTPCSDQLEAFIRDTISSKLLNHIGFNVKETDSALTRIGRTKIFSLLCWLNLLLCIQPALQEYQKNAADISKIHTDLKEIVFCTALRHDEHSQSVWNALWSLYQKTEIAYDKHTILTALACADEEPLIERTLVRVISQVPKHDQKYFINALGYSSISVAAALNFMKSKVIVSKHEALSELDDETLSLSKAILASISSSIQTDTHIQLLEDFENHLKGRDDPNSVSLKNSISSSLQTAQKHTKQNIIIADLVSGAIHTIKNLVLELEFDNTPIPTDAGVTILPSCLYLLISTFIVFIART